ncbi:hypothetical protein [Geminisphaera colitermitum]|uniref:hypothetical protein n=1 Tax=Geminisphaera colitermitum TaxID=1148786 RepID=UPI0012FEE581|nr:hypothetical protein [Geminisphaera colitermitum]
MARTVQRGARLYFYDGKKSPINLGAVEWLPGRGLVFAEMGAQHQGHTHLLVASRIAPDGEESFDFFNADGELFASIYPEDELAGPAVTWADWMRENEFSLFWQEQVELFRNEPLPSFLNS